MDKIYIISDACSNHNQDFERAKELVRASKEVGCDAVKFQLFTADKLWDKEKQPEHHAAAIKSELPKEWIPDLHKLAHSIGLEFAVTVFDLETVDWLIPFVDFYKVASYEMMWFDLLREIDKTGKPFYVSTGMSSRREVFELVNEGFQNLSGIFHCVSNYPAIESDHWMLNQFQTSYPHLPVGWSDHTRSITSVKMATSDADMLEFHIDLDDELGSETIHGHCWHKRVATKMVKAVKQQRIESTREDWDQRYLRTNPETGLRG